jgi:hypothetical protein
MQCGIEGGVPPLDDVSTRSGVRRMSAFSDAAIVPSTVPPQANLREHGTDSECLRPIANNAYKFWF